MAQRSILRSPGPSLTTPPSHRRRMTCCIMVEKGTRVLWTNFCYIFGNKIYHQKEGGPIGARITVAARSSITMAVRSSIRLYMKPTNYVDDVRQGSDQIKKGIRYEKEENKLVYKEEWKQDDIRKNQTDLKRMCEVCLEVMHTIEKDMQFTVENEDYKP